MIDNYECSVWFTVVDVDVTVEVLSSDSLYFAIKVGVIIVIITLKPILVAEFPLSTVLLGHSHPFIFCLSLILSLLSLLLRCLIFDIIVWLIIVLLSLLFRSCFHIPFFLLT